MFDDKLIIINFKTRESNDLLQCVCVHYYVFLSVDNNEIITTIIITQINLEAEIDDVKLSQTAYVTPTSATERTRGLRKILDGVLLFKRTKF